MNAEDTAWVMVCAALVFIMTPGVAFFYGGMARRKNILSILTQCFAIICTASAASGERSRQGSLRRWRSTAAAWRSTDRSKRYIYNF